jgi:predicted HicB family RNase H-like nuclease
MKTQELFSEKIVVKVTSSQKRQITIAAKKENVNISVFVRNLIESKIGKSKKVK